MNLQIGKKLIYFNCITKSIGILVLERITKTTFYFTVIVHSETYENLYSNIGYTTHELEKLIKKGVLFEYENSIEYSLVKNIFNDIGF